MNKKRRKIGREVQEQFGEDGDVFLKAVVGFEVGEKN